MKTTRILSQPTCAFLILLLLVATFQLGVAQDEAEVAAEENDVPQGVSSVQEVLSETFLDLPGLHHPDFGMPKNSKLARTLRPLSKIDLDSDLDYDGTIDNQSKPNQGRREDVPPGFELGVGELSKLVIRFKTYEVEFPGDIYVTLQADGINRFAPTGEFSSDDQEKNATGRIRVWDNHNQENLLIDTDDPEKRKHVWKVDKEKLSSGITGGLPRTLYVEGVEASNQFEGDLSLLLYSSHTISESEPRQPSSMFRTAYDQVLFTVREDPVEKDFVNDNAEGVWKKAKGGVEE